MTPKTPLTIIGGYLGAGKTTLINALLAGDHGQRLAVIVNDFGSINIDAALIENADGETISLANGCICCRIADDLATTLIGLASPDRQQYDNRIDHILIETSGVAEPEKVAAYASALPAFQLSNIVVLVDVETFRARAKDKFVGSLVQRQVKAADLLILTKGDMLDEKIRAERQAEIVDGVKAVIMEGEEARSATERLLGLSARASIASSDRHTHEGDVPFGEHSFTSDTPVDVETLKRHFQGRPAGLHRAKGILHISADRDRRYVLQFAGDRLSVEPDRAWGADRPQTRLVVIGPKGDPDFDVWSQRIREQLFSL